MKTVHRWFPSGRYSLLAHTHLPDSYGGIGVVMVPPFGWEEVCSYRPLRFLGRSLAQRGIPCLRYDLPGTGDSSGGPLDSGLVAAWLRSVTAAAAEIRTVAGVDDVALFGVGLGAMLAVLAATCESKFHDLILWGALPTGRAMLRELRAYANMERWEYTTPNAPAPPQIMAGFEVGGFLITPQTQRDLEAIDLTAISGLGGRRVMILSRDEIPPDARLVRALDSCGCDLRLERGAGYAAMMAVPNESVPPPPSTAQAIAEFLESQPLTHCPEVHIEEAAATLDSGESPIVERVSTIGSSMFGILSEPASDTAPSDCCLLFLNAGGVRHSGPNRMWVDAARRHAARGIASFRLDLPGIGESEGDHNLDIPSLYQEQLVEQVELVIGSLRTRYGFRRFAVIGLCSGAFWAFHAAIRNSDICAAVLLNPRLFFWDPQVDRRRLLRRNATRLTNLSEWSRMIRGGMQLENVKRTARIMFDRSHAIWTGAFVKEQIPAKKMAEAWKAIGRNGTSMTLVFTEGEPLLCEMEQEQQMPPAGNARVRLVRVPNAGHTFRPQWSQQLAHELIDFEIE